MPATTATTAELPTATWELDLTATTVTATATKVGVFRVPARLTVTAGTIATHDDGRGPEVTVVADAGSYASKTARRNDHLRSADFLDVANHPHIRFRAEAATATPDGFRVEGTATVKGVDSALTLDVTGIALDGDRMSFTARGTLDRFALGLGRLPTAIIARDVRLDVTGVAHRA